MDKGSGREGRGSGRHTAGTSHIEPYTQVQLCSPPAGARDTDNYLSRWLGHSSILNNAHLGMPWHMYNWDMRTHATYQVRAYTTAKGYARLERVMRMCAMLYNAALRDWRDAYRQAGVSRTLVDQYKESHVGTQGRPHWLGESFSPGGTRRSEAPRQGEKGVLSPGRPGRNAGLPTVQDL